MKYQTTVNDKQFEIEIDNEGKVFVNGEQRHVDFLSLGADDTLYSLIMETTSHEVLVDVADGNEYAVLIGGRQYAVNVLDERALLLGSRRGDLGGDTGEVTIRSPMPGLIVDVPVAEGDEVTKGQTVIILESMKMQNELKSPRDGTVQRVSVEAGQSVEQKKILIPIISRSINMCIPMVCPSIEWVIQMCDGLNINQFRANALETAEWC
ncbi:MAG: biotin/lipoyl-containing protein, partial [Chloroflexota bacterium]